MRQPAVPAPQGVRPWTEVYIELAARLGILERFNEVGNETWGLAPEHRLDPAERHSVREIAERQAKTIVGDKFSAERLRDSACFITRAKTLAEAYPRPFLEARVPVYFEHLVRTGRSMKALAARLGLDWDRSPYTPLPRFFPCEALGEGGDYDLFIVNFKLPFQNHSVSGENLYIDEISSANPYAYQVMLNRRTAERKGLQDGDRVRIESRYGAETGALRVTELIHPECVGIPGMFGHWAAGRPISAKKGAAFNNLLPAPNSRRIDVISGQIDSCVRVKLVRLQGGTR
jgi:anaerobic selenocysteine-containing dehydrogenase